MSTLMHIKDVQIAEGRRTSLTLCQLQSKACGSYGVTQLEDHTKDFTH